MDQFKSGAFTISIVPSGITLTREEDGSVEYQPGEGNIAADLLTTVMSIESLKVYPAKLNGTPFIVKMSPHKVMELRRENQNENSPGVHFKFSDGTDLIEIIKLGVAKWKDNTTLTGGMKHTGVSSSRLGELIED